MESWNHLKSAPEDSLCIVVVFFKRCFVFRLCVIFEHIVKRINNVFFVSDRFSCFWLNLYLNKKNPNNIHIPFHDISIVWEIWWCVGSVPYVVWNNKVEDRNSESNIFVWTCTKHTWYDFSKIQSLPTKYAEVNKMYM